MTSLFAISFLLSIVFTFLCMSFPQKFLFFLKNKEMRTRKKGISCGLCINTILLFLFGYSNNPPDDFAVNVVFIGIMAFCIFRLRKNIINSKITSSENVNIEEYKINLPPLNKPSKSTSPAHESVAFSLSLYSQSEQNDITYHPDLSINNSPDSIVNKKNDSTIIDFDNDEPSSISYMPYNDIPPNFSPDTFWIPLGNNVKIHGYNLPDGMIYFGCSNTSCSDAALIDPSLPVKNSRDYENTQMGYWPNYSNISPEARGCYLSWLAEGKKDPAANIGYVFLYFYGLERRLVLFVNNDPALKNEKQLIIAEIERLLSIYGANGSFYMYATSLLSYVNILDLANTIQYNKPVPKPTYHRDIPLELKVGIAQMAKDQIPLPMEWALNWYLSIPDPPVYSRTVAQRCYPEFQKLFAEKYKKRFNDGILVKPNKTKLSYSYRPASGTFLGENHITTSELSDISAIKKYINSLIPLIQECHDELDRYSRFLGRNPDKVDTIDALLELPISIWPNETLEKFESILNKINNTPLSMSFTDFLKLIPRWENHSKCKLATFLDIAENYLGISMEPDCRINGKIPSLDSTIVLFTQDQQVDIKNLLAPQYAFASLVVRLMTLVTQVDGKISSEGRIMLMSQIDKWLWIDQNIKPRLKAYATLMGMQPMNMSGIKRRLNGLDSSQRNLIATVLIQISQADGKISVEELKLLEKIFKVLELDTIDLYNQMNQSSFEPVTVSTGIQQSNDFSIAPPPSNVSGNLQLDMNKVAALKNDSDKVASLLSEIFSSDNESVEVSHHPTMPTKQNKGSALWGLPNELSKFVYHIVVKSSWTLAELEASATEHGIMLDGALEEINDAAFDTFDEALIEDNGDIFEINQEIVRVISK